MKSVYILLCISIFSAFLTTTYSQTKNRALLWSDEFDYTGLPDSGLWSYEEGFVRNKELQYYTKGRLENARVENGKLIIEARQDHWEGHEITSASIHTYGKKSILYGRVEVKAKIPVAMGTWPAIWMLGDNIKEGVGWPKCGEIDIMEHVGFDPNTIHANIHTLADKQVDAKKRSSNIKCDDLNEKFHIYALEWYPDHMDFYFDNQLYFTYFKEDEIENAWPFDKPQYIILNLAFGGSWGGQKGVDKTSLPRQYEIDYVRVYKISDQ